MENLLKNCLTIQVSEEEVNSPDFDISNYVNKKIKKAWFKNALEGLPKNGMSKPPTASSPIRETAT